MKKFFWLYGIICILLVVFSYLFVDGNLARTSFVGFYVANRPLAAAVYVALLAGLWALFFLARRKVTEGGLVRPWLILGLLLLFSYPAFSYDMFNYIATAKVTFLYRENPYLVMPIEITGEPMLAYTRAANKVALYGPTWIALTGIPYVVGLGNVWATIFSMKALVAVFYAGIAWLIYKVTKRWEDVWYFALNPLVLVEVLVSGHNDVVMMFLALSGLVIAARHRIAGWVLWFASVWVKGATVVLAPVMFLRDPLSPQALRLSYGLMSIVFLLSPLREEMYPWYALWLVPIAALMGRKERFLRGLTIALTFGLSFRHVPYIATAEYGGTGPMTRTLVTVIPVAVFLLWFKFRTRK
jgi:hypothetical protein